MWGLAAFIARIIVTLIPLIVGVLIGKYIFKWNGALILGACAGAMTTTAAIGAVCEKAKSNVSVLSYTVTYAVGNILLTLWWINSCIILCLNYIILIVFYRKRHRVLFIEDYMLFLFLTLEST